MTEEQKEQPSKERTTIYLSTELRTRMLHHMADTRETATKIIDKALTEYLDKYEKRRE